MAYSSMSGSHTSSTLFPLSTSHLHTIRKPYELPSFDPPSPFVPSPATRYPAISSTKVSGNTSSASRREINDDDDDEDAERKGEGSSSSSSFYAYQDSNTPEIRNGLERLVLARKIEKDAGAKVLPQIPVRTATSPHQQPQTFFPVSYIRGEWMEKLLDLDLGKRKIRYFLSDETLCLGTPSAPITSEFSRGLTFYEAYKHGSNPEDSTVYMSGEQVIWLIDELYSILGARNSKLAFEDINIDNSKKVELKEFKAIRRISFKNNVAGFRKRCGIPMTTKATALVNQKPLDRSQLDERAKQDWANRALPQGTPKESICSGSPAPQTGPSFPVLKPASVAAILPEKNSVNDVESEKSKIAGSDSHIESPSSTDAIKTAPTSFVSKTKAERQARLQAQREEALRKHLELQRRLLPLHRQLYRNLKRYGGAALACDVESWTEDAEVLLELGMAWFVWTPSVTGDDTVERDGGSCHYIIEETIQYRNEEIEATRWDYSFGNSETLPQNKVSEKLRMKVNELSKYGPLVLVFHDASAETRYFQKLGVDSDLFPTIPPTELSSPNPTWPSIPTTTNNNPMIIIQDTQNLFAGWSNPQIKQINLGKACSILGLENEARKLHNAGNDAFATLRMWEILLEMEGNQNQTDSSPLNNMPAVDVLSKGESRPEHGQGQNTRVEIVKDEKQQEEAAFPDLIELW